MPSNMEAFFSFQFKLQKKKRVFCVHLLVTFTIVYYYIKTVLNV